MCLTLPETTKMNNKYCGMGKENFTPERIWEIFYDHGVMDNVTQK